MTSQADVTVSHWPVLSNRRCKSSSTIKQGGGRSGARARYAVSHALISAARDSGSRPSVSHAMPHVVHIVNWEVRQLDTHHRCKQRESSLLPHHLTQKDMCYMRRVQTI